MNRLKQSRGLFNGEYPQETIDVGNPLVFALLKWSADGRERALIALNQDGNGQQSFQTHTLSRFLSGTARVEEISPDGELRHSPDLQSCFLKPHAFHVLWAQAA